MTLIIIYTPNDDNIFKFKAEHRDGVCRWGPVGQAMLLRDVHAALLRVLETVEDVLLPPPDEAGELAPPELGPHNAFRHASHHPPQYGCLDPSTMFSAQR